METTMRIRVLAVAFAASAALSLVAIEAASARVSITSSRTVSNGFSTCKFVKQTSIGDFGDRASRSVRVCRSNF
jgi:hypothetical protein